MAAQLLATHWSTAAGLAVLALPLAKKKHMRTSPNAIDRNWHQPIFCRFCSGSGQRPCTLCNETGTLGRGGFARRNTLRVNSLVGTQWTSVQGIEGKWRHFRCVSKRGRNARDGIAVLSSTCGPARSRIQIEVPVSELKNREIWQGGWTTLEQIRAGGVGPQTVCSACRGEKKIVCPRCDGIGQLGL